MAEKNPFAKLKWTTILAIKTGLFGLGMTLGVQYGQDLTAAWHGLTHSHQPAAEYYHHDGYRVQIENTTNDKGEFLTHVVYNGKRIEVYEDLLPSNVTMMNTLNERVGKISQEDLHSLDAKTQLLQMNIDKQRGIEPDIKLSEVRKYGESNPQLFNAMGPAFKTYALDRLYNQLIQETYGGESNGK